MGADRLDLVLPGCAVFQAIRSVWPVEEVTVADRGLREGMLLRMMDASAAERRRPAPRRPGLPGVARCPA